MYVCRRLRAITSNVYTTGASHFGLAILHGKNGGFLKAKRRRIMETQKYFTNSNTESSKKTPLKETKIPSRDIITLL
jgi:hypothetical protein